VAIVPLINDFFNTFGHYLARVFHVPAAFITKTLKAAAVVSFCKALITKLMEAIIYVFNTYWLN